MDGRAKTCSLNSYLINYRQLRVPGVHGGLAISRNKMLADLKRAPVLLRPLKYIGRTA